MNRLERDTPENPDGSRGLPLLVTTTAGDRLSEGEGFVWEAPDVQNEGYRHNHEVHGIRILDERLSADDELLVSFYHAALPHREEHRVCCSLRHPGVLELLSRQAKLVQEHLGPKRWFINHDEVWAVGHDPLADGDSPATLLAENLHECIRIIRQENGEAQIVLNSDMYDPYHNSLPETNRGSFYPMVNGSFLGSWRAIPSEVAIWNWSLGEATELCDVENEVKASFHHFDVLGCQQIVGGFYDVTYNSGAGDDVAAIRERARSQFRWADQNGDIRGVCYYTTKRNLDYLELFAEVADEVWGDDS